MGPDRPRSSIEPSSVNILALGSSGHKSPIIRIFVLECVLLCKKTVSGWGFAPDPSGKFMTPHTPYEHTYVSHRALDAQNGRASSIFSVLRRLWILRSCDDSSHDLSIHSTDDVGGPAGGGTSLVCPRAQKTLVTPLVALQLLVYRHKIREVEDLKEVLHDHLVGTHQLRP